MIVRLEKEEALRLLEAERSADRALAVCAMCRLAQPDRKTLRVAESGHGVAVLDEYAATRGHVLVIAREHVESGAELPWEVYADLSRLVWEASRVLDQSLYPERIYTATLGASQALPMSFPHHHTHVIPIYDTDERARPAHVFSWSSSVARYEPGEAEALARELREGWEAKLHAARARAGAAWTTAAAPTGTRASVDERHEV